MSKFTKLVTKSLLRCNPTFKMLRKIKMFRHKTITNNLFLINTAKKLIYKVKNIMKIFNQSNQTRFLHIRFFNQQILVNLKPTLRQPIMEALNQTQTSCKCLNVNFFLIHRIQRAVRNQEQNVAKNWNSNGCN